MKHRALSSLTHFAVSCSAKFHFCHDRSFRSVCSLTNAGIGAPLEILEFRREEVMYRNIFVIFVLAIGIGR